MKQSNKQKIFKKLLVPVLLFTTVGCGESETIRYVNTSGTNPYTGMFQIHQESYEEMTVNVLILDSSQWTSSQELTVPVPDEDYTLEISYLQESGASVSVYSEDEDNAEVYEISYPADMEPTAVSWMQEKKSLSAQSEISLGYILFGENAVNGSEPGDYTDSSGDEGIAFAITFR